MLFNRLALSIFWCLALVLVAAGCSAPQESPKESAKEGSADPAPARSPERDGAADTTGDHAPLPEVVEVNTAQLADLIKKSLGKITVVNIWATFCPPCIQEMPDLVAFYNDTDRSHVAFVSLSVDDVAEIKEGIPRFQREHQMPFPVYVLNERNDEGMVQALRGPFEGVIPATYVYDQSGACVATMVGAVTRAELQKVIKPLLPSDDTE